MSDSRNSRVTARSAEPSPFPPDNIRRKPRSQPKALCSSNSAVDFGSGYSLVSRKVMKFLGFRDESWQEFVPFHVAFFSNPFD
jgi:hypothetical protein